MASFIPHPVVWDDEKIVRYWDYLSRMPSALEKCWSRQVGRALLSHVSRRVALRGRILDYGCGPGYLVGDLLEMTRDGVVYGADSSPESLRVVEERFGAHPRFGGVSPITGLPTTYESGQFDTVFFIETIEHLRPDQQRESLQELRRLLRPGGVVIVTTPNEENLEANTAICPECGAIFHPVQHMSSWDRTKLTSVMEKSGFRTKRCEAVHLQEKRRWLFSLVARLYRNRRLPHLVYIGVDR